MLNLTIQHVIHLTRNQRYALHAGIDLVVTGVSVPVWYMDKTTSEPAREVFCNYYIKNNREEQPVVAKDDGFEFTLPFRQGKSLDISLEDWRELNLKNPEKLERMYEQCVQEVSSKNLLDIGDGGAAYLNYREHSEVVHEDRKMHIIHHVTICDMERLQESLC